MPVPATEGLKMPPLTPVPLYVPPVGEPPLSANEVALIHTDELDGQVTTGNAFTVMVKVQLLVQPVTGSV